MTGVTHLAAQPVHLRTEMQIAAGIAQLLRCSDLLRLGVQRHTLCDLVGISEVDLQLAEHRMQRDGVLSLRPRAEADAAVVVSLPPAPVFPDLVVVWTCARCGHVVVDADGALCETCVVERGRDEYVAACKRQARARRALVVLSEWKGSRDDDDAPAC